MKFKLRRTASVILMISMIITSTLFLSIFAFGSAADGLAAYYKFDGNLNDDSGNANNGTAIGNITFVPGINGQAAQFDGQSYVEVPSNSTLDVGKNFSVSMWVYKDHDSSDDTTALLVKNGDDKVHQAPIRIYDRLLKPYFCIGHTTGDFRIISNTIVDMHKWEFLTFTYDGTEMKTYVDGALTDTKAYSKDMLVSTGKLQIGGMFYGNKNWYYKGYMDEVRLYNKTLNYGDVQSMYNEIVNGTGKNIVIKPNQLMAHFKLNGNLEDSSAFKNNATVIGTEKFGAGVQGKSFVFDGATYLEVPDSDSLEADGGLTLSAWVKPDTTGTTWTEWPILDRTNSSVQDQQSSFEFMTKVLGQGKAANLNFYVLNEGSTSPTGHVTRSYPTAPGNWYMYTVTFDQKTRTMTYYMNGVQIDNFSNPYMKLRHSNGKLIIGMINGNRFFKGNMDEVRLYNYAMNAGEVKGLYAYRDTLKVTTAQVTLNAKKALQLKVLSVSPVKTEAPVDVTSVVSYSSSKATIAKVSPAGVVTAVGKGKAVITVTNGISKATVNVVVK